MLWPWVYIVEENSNKIYVKKHLEEVLYSNRTKNKITHIRNVKKIKFMFSDRLLYREKQRSTALIWLIAQYVDCKINRITALSHFNPKIQNKNK